MFHFDFKNNSLETVPGHKVLNLMCVEFLVFLIFVLTLADGLFCDWCSLRNAVCFKQKQEDR
jgi:uncharacterized membrane protein